MRSGHPSFYRVVVHEDRGSSIGVRTSTWLSKRQVDWLVLLTTVGLALPAVVKAAANGQLAISLAVLPFATVPLLWRRRHPAIVLSLLLGALAVSAAVGRSVPSNVGVLFGLYAAARYGGPRLRAISGAATAAASVAAFTALLLTDRARITPHLTAAVLFGAAGAWVLGEAARTRHAYLAELEDRATRLEFERDEHARRAAERERIRIARELHDVVTHHVSVIAVQAAAAHSTSRARPERALDALGVIERTARSTLGELRTLLGVLRAADDPAAAHSPLRPRPSISEVDELIAGARSAGLRVSVEVCGDCVPLDAVVDLCAYRVLQEALTNVINHAPSAQATVLIEYQPEMLHVNVSDSGPGMGPPNPGGHGLIGMRERVELAGGALTTGPGERGGFVVDARLPVSGSVLIADAAPERGGLVRA
jgi:signal transduction histidine kinase